MQSAALRMYMCNRQRCGWLSRREWRGSTIRGSARVDDERIDGGREVGIGDGRAARKRWPGAGDRAESGRMDEGKSDEEGKSGEEV